MTTLMPATPSHIETWIVERLKPAPLKREELLKHVNAVAENNGFFVDRLALKVAINRLSRNERIVHVQHGWWGLPGWNAEYVKRSHAI